MGLRTILLFVSLALLTFSCSDQTECTKKEPGTVTLHLKADSEIFLGGVKTALGQLKRDLRDKAKSAPKEIVEDKEVSLLGVLIKTEGDVRYEGVAKALEACAGAGMRRTSFAHAEVDEGKEVSVWLPVKEPLCKDVIALEARPGTPVTTLQMIRVRLLWAKPDSYRESTDPKSGRILLKVNNVLFRTAAKEPGDVLPDYKRFREHVRSRKQCFVPTKSYERLPVIIHPSPLAPFKHVIMALKECVNAGIKDIYFAKHGDYFAEEVETAKKVPPSARSMKGFEPNSNIDAYHIEGGRYGAYGQRWGKKALEREGGSEHTEKAVTAALRWLNFHQDKDGKWDQDGYSKNCDAKKEPNCGKCDIGQYDVGVTGLALLAYLGNGHTHRCGLFKKTVKRGINWLVKQQQSDGSFGPRDAESWIYSHAIGTLALCEFYAMTRDYRYKDATRKAVDFIVKAQNPGAGWKYRPKSGKSDSSVTGWMVLALRVAKGQGIGVEQSVFDDTIKWFDRATNKAGKCCYMRPGDHGSIVRSLGSPWDYLPAMTGVSVFCRILCGQKRTEKKITKGSDILMANLPCWNRPKNNKVDMYYWFWATNAMFQCGGEKWHKWNKAVKKALLETQRVGGCADGSWDPVGRWGRTGGRVYATAINALTLETYYRYKRANPGKRADGKKK